MDNTPVDKRTEDRLTEILKDATTPAYIGDVLDGEVRLDGWFSAELLRKIAEAIEVQ